jgi:hypothetical protein
MATFIPLAARLRPGVVVGELFVAWGLAGAASWVLAADSRLPTAGPSGSKRSHSRGSGWCSSPPKCGSPCWSLPSDTKILTPCATRWRCGRRRREIASFGELRVPAREAASIWKLSLLFRCS